MNINTKAQEQDMEEIYSQVRMGGLLLDFYQNRLDDTYTCTYKTILLYITFEDQRIFSYHVASLIFGSVYSFARPSAHGPLLSSSGMQTVLHLSLLSAPLT